MSDDVEDGERGREPDQSVDRSDRRSDDGNQRDDRQSGKQEASTAEKVVMVISVTFTVLLFAYAGWQMTSAPTTGPPEVSVVETAPLEDDGVAVTVRFGIRRTSV